MAASAITIELKSGYWQTLHQHMQNLKRKRKVIWLLLSVAFCSLFLANQLFDNIQTRKMPLKSRKIQNIDKCSIWAKTSIFYKLLDFVLYRDMSTITRIQLANLPALRLKSQTWRVQLKTVKTSRFSNNPGGFSRQLFP